MSNPDSFIDEVTEEVRRDRLFGLFRRYGWIAGVVVVAIVGGAAWNEWQKAEARQAAQALGDAVLTALDAASPADRATALAEVPAATAQGAAVVSLIAAAEAAAAGTPEAMASARAALDALAADAALDPLWRDLAALRSLALAGDTLAPAARRSTLEGLAAQGRPYRVLAQEQLAILALEEGRDADAATLYRGLVDDPEAPAGLRQRAAQVMVLLGQADGG